LVTTETLRIARAKGFNRLGGTSRHRIARSEGFNKLGASCLKTEAEPASEM